MGPLTPMAFLCSELGGRVVRGACAKTLIIHLVSMPKNSIFFVIPRIPIQDGKKD